MIRKEFNFQTKQVLQRQTAALLVQVASRFESRIMIECNSKVINAKSMLGLLSLGTDISERMYLVADGNDEQQAADTIIKLVASNFTVM